MTPRNEALKHFVMFARNERWGTCVDCPRTSTGEIFPEFCEHTDRYDHHIGVDELARAWRAAHASSSAAVSRALSEVRGTCAQSVPSASMIHFSAVTLVVPKKTASSYARGDYTGWDVTAIQDAARKALGWEP